MRVRSFLIPCLVGLLSSCGGGGDGSQATPTPTCSEAMSHLDQCVDAYCEAHADETCEILKGGQSPTLFGSSQDTCTGLTATDLDHLASASCEQLIQEAKLLASGKADFDCPAWFPWCNSLAPDGATYRVNVLSFDKDAASLEVLLPDIPRTMEVHEGKAFQKLGLRGAGETRTIGRPAVPEISFLLGLPPGVDEVSIDGWEVLDMRSATPVNLIPAQYHAQEDFDTPPFQYDAQFYSQDTAWPPEEAKIGELQTWRNYRVVRVTVHPLQYNPGRKALDVALRAQLNLKFHDTVAEPKDTVDEGASSSEAAYATGMVNYPEAVAAGTAKDDGGDPNRVRYLVIAHDPLIEALQPLVNLKNLQGLKTEVVKLSEVGADPAKIKERIAKAYADSAIEYALLVGDVADLPMFVFQPEQSESSYWGGGDPLPSDVWYGLHAGDDLLPEVSIGRLSAKTPEELAVHVNKLVTYQLGEAEAEWRKRLVLVAHEQEYPRKYTECSESVRAKRYRPGMLEFVKLYGGEHVTTQQLLDTINQGTGVIAYRGHGSETAWAEWNGEDFGGAHDGMTNGGMTPIVLSIACLNMALQHDSPTNAEQWVNRKDGGAVAFLGATQPSWTKVNHDFMRYLFQGLLDEGIVAIGPLVNRANAALLAQYANSKEASDNVKMYAWLGDPALEVKNTWKTRPEVRVGWCNLQWPPSMKVAQGAETEIVFGQVWVQGRSEGVGQGQGVEAMVGYGPQGSDPTKDGWTWAPASYNLDRGNNDEYMGKLKAPSKDGTYAYALRFKGETDDAWVVCDMDGTQNGVDASQLGTLVVGEPVVEPPDAGVEEEASVEEPEAGVEPEAGP